MFLQLLIIDLDKLRFFENFNANDNKNLKQHTSLETLRSNNKNAGDVNVTVTQNTKVA